MPQPCHEDEARAILEMVADPHRRAVNDLVVAQFATLVAMVGMSFYVAAIAIMLAYPDVNAIR